MYTKISNLKKNRKYSIFLKEERESAFVFLYQGMLRLNFGISFDFHSPNIEFHLPFCMIRIGWIINYYQLDDNNNRIYIAGHNLNKIK